MRSERNVSIRLIRSDEIPGSVEGCILQLDGDDNYMMIINSDRDERAQVISYLHECLHIWHRDHGSGRTVNEIEKDRHEELRELLEAMRQ